MKRWIVSIGIVICASFANAADVPSAWPQFRGPEGSGIADGQKLPVEFGPEKNVKWKVAIPSGFSSPIVVGDKLVLTAFDDGKLYTLAYNRADGSEAWRAEAPAKKFEPFHRTEGSPAASTPVTDGKRIVSYFGSCGLFCYDLAGKELWRYELPTVTTMGDFGTGVSPILAEDAVVLLRDEMKDPKILAVNLQTGKLAWERKRQSRTGFGTPVVCDSPEGKQVVAPGFGQMIGYDLKTGEEKWFVPGMPSACCTSPVAIDGTLFFAGWSPGDTETEDAEFKMPSYDDILKFGDANGDGVLSKEEAEKTPMKDFFNSMDANHDGKYTREEADEAAKFMANSKNTAFALKAGGSGDVTESLLWKKNRGLPYVASAIVYRGQYVMIKNGGLVTAYDAKTGDEIYVQKRVAEPGVYYASPVAANGNIYLTSLADGAVTILKAGTAAPEVVAKNPPLGERVAATPAIADGTLYIRTAAHLYAFAEKQ